MHPAHLPRPRLPAQQGPTQARHLLPRLPRCPQGARRPGRDDGQVGQVPRRPEDVPERGELPAGRLHQLHLPGGLHHPVPSVQPGADQLFLIQRHQFQASAGQKDPPAARESEQQIPRASFLPAANGRGGGEQSARAPANDLVAGAVPSRLGLNRRRGSANGADGPAGHAPPHLRLPGRHLPGKESFGDPKFLFLFLLPGKVLVRRTDKQSV